MFVRQLHYLVAVAREEHFGRAAEACHVSQPALSAGIRKLEEELGQPLIIRGHRFLGLTEEGERVLQWARRIVADYDGMRQELSGTRGELAGQLRIGAIPTALPALPDLVNAFCGRHPLVRVQIQALSASAILRGLDKREIDAGVTYLDEAVASRPEGIPLFEERYVFVTRSNRFAGRASVTWAEAAEEPLCLLTRDMQNRRIIDEVLASLGIAVVPRIEVNSFMGVWPQVRAGGCGSIVPHTHVAAFGEIDGLHALPLVEPICCQSIALVASDRAPLTPVTAALMRLARRRPAPAGEAALLR